MAGTTKRSLRLLPQHHRASFRSPSDRARVLRNRTARFEAFCDELGFEMNSGKTTLEIQSDKFRIHRTFLWSLETPLWLWKVFLRRAHKIAYRTAVGVHTLPWVSGGHPAQGINKCDDKAAQEPSMHETRLVRGNETPSRHGKMSPS